MDSKLNYKTLAIISIIIVSFGIPSALADEPTDRVRQILETNSTGATVGLYLKEVNGTVLAEYNEEFPFEPASTIKVAHYLNALVKVQNDSNFNMTSQVSYFQNATSGGVLIDDDLGTSIDERSQGCPVDTNPSSNNLMTGLRAMMGVSDNRWTEAFRVLLGEAAINDMMQNDLGMTDSFIQHRMGCGNDAVANHNQLTLVDAGKLYEAVANGFLDPSTKNLFYNNILIEVPLFPTIMDQEAVGLELSSDGLDDFKSLGKSAVKGGSYGLSDGLYRTVAGWAKLPFKDASCNVIPHEYVYGAFINAADTLGPVDNIRAQGMELFREQIRAALETWEDCEADLEIQSFNVSQTPNEVLIGESVDVILTKEIINNGPASPVNVNVTVTTTTTAGLDVNATKATQQVDSVDDSTTVVIETLRLTCTGPGIQDAVFSNFIFPIDKIDPDLTYNDAEVSVQFDCVIPVEINIHPASDPNSINIIKKNGVMAVAILSTDTFDANMVDPSSAHFGPEDVLFDVNPPGGATEFHNKGHIEDSFELDEVTQDGDLDMLLHFKAKDTGLDETDTEGCVKGEIDIGGMLFTFLGCDDIRILP